MKNLTIGKRISFGFAVILILLAAMAGTSFYLLKQVKERQADIINQALPGITAAGQVKFLVCEIEFSVLRHLTAKTPEDKKTFENDIDSQAAEIQTIFDDYQKNIVRAEDKEQFNRIMAAREVYIKARSQVLELSRASKDVEAMDLTKSTLRPLYAAYLKECDGLFEEDTKFGAGAAAASEKAMVLANTLTATLTIISISLGMLFAFLIVRGISHVLKNVAGTLGDGSYQVASAASQVSAASQTLAEGSSEQASSLEETSASLEELASMTKRNAENARSANEIAKEARAAADKGAGDMQTMSAAMEAIKVSSDDIAKIIKTIDEIAFQTNILALNAAVEAARAGEAGMGFAVVADEVRNLAQRCAQAAKETAGKIEGAITKTGQGVEISGKVAAALNDIVAKVRQVDDLVSEVASASREQTDGITQINTAVSQMDKVTQGNAASAEESAAAAQELSGQSEVMKQSVAELLQLVGSHSEAAATPSPASHGHAPVAHRQVQREIPMLPAQASSAGIVSWNEEKMATGVSSVDSQHQELIRRINDLHADCVAGKAREELMEHLDFLGTYATSHFASEEKIMDEHRCPSRGQNKAAHAKFLQDYERVVAMVKENGASSKAAIELKRMLGDWLTSHICRIDVALRKCPGAQHSNGSSANHREAIPMEGDFKSF